AQRLSRSQPAARTDGRDAGSGSCRRHAHGQRRHGRRPHGGVSMIAPKVAENALRFDSVTLANGLRIIGEHNPAAASVAAGYFVHTGARDETPEVSGVSHFLEHMAFKGNDQYSPEDINRIFDEIG